MNASNGAAAFALNINSLNGIRSKAEKAPDVALKEAAQAFEGLLLQRMLHSMRESIPDSGLLSSHQTKMYRDLLDKQLAKSMSQRSIGLAEIMVRQLQGKVESDGEHGGHGDSQVDHRVAGVQAAHPKPLASMQTISNDHLPQSPTQTNDSQTDDSLFGSRAEGGLLANQTTPPKVDVNDSNLPDYAKQFLNKLSEPAEKVAREIGISPRLILAQAALETGWGRYGQTTDDGTETFNIFNIKAGNRQFDTTRAKTLEFLNGQSQTVYDDFRVYNSYQEALKDYADLIGNSPRYRAVVAAPNAEEAAERLQKTGYATDPNYARKLKAIMSQIAVDDVWGQPLINRDGNSLVDLYSTMSSDDSGPQPKNGAIGVG